jgi:hypothetical protein
VQQQKEKLELEYRFDPIPDADEKLSNALDTIRVKYVRPMSLEQLRDWHQYTHFKPDGTMSRRYILNTSLDLGSPDAALLGCRVSIRATYVPVDDQGNPILTIETSLPKAVFGNNFTMIRDLAEATFIANQLLARIPALPSVDLAEGILIRIDACYNHQVGPLVPHYINAIGTLDYPHRRTRLHRNEGAEFRSKHNATKFYDKLQEAKHPDAYGILRQESTFLSPKRIADLLGKQQPTLADVSTEWVVSILEADLERLRLHDRIIANAGTSFAILCEKYGPYAGPFYWALLKNNLTIPKRALAKTTKLHPRSLDRRLKDITDAGVALTLTDTVEPLPPLEIDL